MKPKKWSKEWYEYKSITFKELIKMYGPKEITENQLFIELL